MNTLFPSLTPDRECALLLLARERRKTRPNLAAWRTAQLQLSRGHSAHSQRTPGVITKHAVSQNTVAKRPVV
jgi:hypothetical protein